MKREVILDGAVYSLTFEEMVSLTEADLSPIDAGLHEDQSQVIDDAVEILFSDYSNSKEQWNESIDFKLAI